MVERVSKRYPLAMIGFIGVAFCLSGATGLVYEVIWSRYLRLLLGGTALAQILVLGTFMAGLALGNHLFGRLADRPLGKLRLYALLELGLGLYCLLFPQIFDLLRALYLTTAIQVGVDSPLLPILKSVICIASILIPTMLMGGTLPVMAKFLVRRLAEVGSRIGLLYFLNTAGACAGAYLGGFILIEALGLRLAVILTAMVNLGLGLAFLLLSRNEAAQGERSAGPTDPLPYSSFQVAWTLAVIGISGALTMLYELAWIRLAGMVFGSSIHSFTVMLMTFIGGIALGSAVAAWLLKSKRDALLWLALCEAGICLTVLALLPAYERMPYWFLVLASTLDREGDTFWQYQLVKIALSMLVLMAPTILIGMTLPLATRVAARGVPLLGRNVGSVFSINALGSVVGVALTGFVILPGLGLEHTIQAGMAASGLLAVILLAIHHDLSGRLKTLVSLGLCALVAASLWLLPQWDMKLLHAGDVPGAPPRSAGILRRFSPNL